MPWLGCQLHWPCCGRRTRPRARRLACAAGPCSRDTKNVRWCGARVKHPRRRARSSPHRCRRPARAGPAQVAMQRWREHALDSVAAMYEDRFDLWGLAPGGRLLRRSVPARRARVRAPRPYQGTLVCAVAPLHAGHRRTLAQEPRRCCVVPCGRRAPVLAEGSVQAPQHGTARLPAATGCMKFSLAVLGVG